MSFVWSPQTEWDCFWMHPKNENIYVDACVCLLCVRACGVIFPSSPIGRYFASRNRFLTKNFRFLDFQKKNRKGHFLSTTHIQKCQNSKSSKIPKVILFSDFSPLYRVGTFNLSELQTAISLLQNVTKDCLIAISVAGFLTFFGIFCRFDVHKTWWKLGICIEKMDIILIK
jgi:hypothetical protein